MMERWEENKKEPQADTATATDAVEDGSHGVNSADDNADRQEIDSSPAVTED